MVKRLLLVLFPLLVLTGCYTLRAPTVSNSGRLRNYSCVYIIPTGGISANSGIHGGLYGNQLWIHGGATKTTNPSEVISGYLMKKGYAILPNLSSSNAEKSLVVSYGNVGKRDMGFLAYSCIVLVQFRDAKTNELIASSEAEGCGEDESEDILQAITRALDALFN